MPSHLNEPKNKEKKRKALADGLILEEDITCNDGADKLAGDGALSHLSNQQYVRAANMRKDLTVIAQKIDSGRWQKARKESESDSSE